MNLNKLVTLTIILSVFIKIIFASPAQNLSETWLKYTKSVNQGEPYHLPNWSKAGYLYGNEEPEDLIITQEEDGTWTNHTPNSILLDVTHPDFGAIPNDNLSDIDNIVLAVNRAHDLAEDNVGTNVIIFFPPGKYDLRSFEDFQALPNGYHWDKTKRKMIDITHKNIFIKGAGNTQTILYQHYPMRADSGQNGWSANPIVRFRNSTNGDDFSYHTSISSNAQIGKMEIEVLDSNHLNPGDIIKILSEGDTGVEAINDYLCTRAGDPLALTHTDLHSHGVEMSTLYEIESISNNLIKLKQPLHKNIFTGYVIQKMDEINRNTGIEDLTIEGGFTQNFYHHYKDFGGSSNIYIDDWPMLGGLTGNDIDYGWTGVTITESIHSYMRRIIFKNTVRAASVSKSLNITISDCEVTGNKGHFAISASDSASHVLLINCRDTSSGYDAYYNKIQKGAHHSFGLSGKAAGTVFLGCQYPEHSCFDAHPRGNYATLFDNLTGALNYYRYGGKSASYPQHGGHLVFWNSHFVEIRNGFKFWRDDIINGDKLAPPTMVGATENDPSFTEINFAENQLREAEYLNLEIGEKAFPPSLYVAQKEFDRGFVPNYLKNFNNDLYSIFPDESTAKYTHSFSTNLNIEGTIYLVPHDHGTDLTDLENAISTGQGHKIESVNGKITNWSLPTNLSVNHHIYLYSGGKTIQLGKVLATDQNLYYPNEDSYIRYGDYKTENYGNKSRLEVKGTSNSSSYTRKTYLQFSIDDDLSLANQLKLHLSIRNQSDFQHKIKVIHNSTCSEKLTASSVPNYSPNEYIYSANANESSVTIDLNRDLSKFKEIKNLTIVIESLDNNWMSYYSKENSNQNLRPSLEVVF